MLNNFGSAFTLKNIEDESYMELQCMQLCLNAVERAQDMKSTKDTFYSKENM